MKSKLKSIIKNSKILYNLYYGIMSLVLKILAFMNPGMQKIILFVSMGGKFYGGNLKPIYENMLQDKRFSEWKFVWAFCEPSKFKLPDVERTYVCAIDTIEYYKHALQALCWMTDVSIQRGLNFKRPETVYVNVWHGAVCKSNGDEQKEGVSYKIKKREEFDLFLTETNYDSLFWQRVFGIKKERITMLGYPRNDIMFGNRESIRRKVRQKYNIPYDKKIFLYAPTYRDYVKDNLGRHVFRFHLSIKKIKEILGDEYVFSLRVHSAIDVSQRKSGEWIDMSDYASTEEILIASDILITDYSSIMIDYCVLEKPFACLWDDYDEYIEKRGLAKEYLELDIPNRFYQEDKLYHWLKNMDYAEEVEKTKLFKKSIGGQCDKATPRVTDAVYNLIKNI